MARAASAVTLLLVTGCGAGGPPEVVFAAGGHSVTARPTQYCDVRLAECAADATAPVELAVPPGTALRVAVPEEISETPWVVVFRYRSGGEVVDERSALFAPGQRGEYVLELPDADARLLTAQVQQLGPPPQANAATGEIEFPVRGSWVLTAAA